MLAVSLGEPAGISPDIIIQAWLQRLYSRTPDFFVCAPAWVLEERADILGLDVPIARCSSIEAAGLFKDYLPVIDMPADVPVRPGIINRNFGEIVVNSIRLAISETLAGNAKGLVTGPIAKSTLHLADIQHNGHTEFLADIARTHFPDQEITPVMMLCNRKMRVAVVTGHIALKDVPGALSANKLKTVIEVVHRELQSKFAISKPRIAITGLNPHAGEDGMMGDEEKRIIGPTIESLKLSGMDLDGPIAADSLFSPNISESYDAIVAMYHDQGLIPIKCQDFYGGVNVTLGLPFIRTSPGHGTALSLAGTGASRPDSFIAALRTANSIAANTSRAPDIMLQQASA